MKPATLTFDNGPHPDVTPQVLDVLRSRDVSAAFFVCGRQIDGPGGRDLLQQIHDAGHVIGNHTYSHVDGLGAKRAGVGLCEDEIGRTQELLGDVAADERWFRPAGGGGVLSPDLLSQAVVRYLVDHHHSMVLWNSVPRDWVDTDGWVDTALSQMEPIDWPVVVVHDLPTGAMAHLQEFLDRGAEAGFEFRTEFPDACTPIRAGEITGSLEGLVTP